MNAESVERAGTDRESIGPLRLLSTFWGVAVLVLLAGYSIVHAVDQAPAAGGAQRTALAAAAATAQPASPFASFVPAASYPEVAREPVVLNIACGADDVQRGGGGAGRYPITMRFDQVPDDIRALVAGTDTVFPKDARVNMSPCIRGMIERGELP